ncbi:energy transducer TonB [Mucilaginibacter rigui]|uniref:Energy transducer TonB n=1 Tax=Mucilaginibacter rigui TaxID=534635 RepID=A0ABR7X5D4_9SPHI|nr:energy transducer TonB [Mucilaginibacter rigui]MBD1384825.1 energy transducer TonB [Mucilaginibacter rigui]
MKRFLTTISCLCLFAIAKAQTPATPPEVIEIEETKPKVDTSERPPTFVGGEKQLAKYFSRNLRELFNPNTHGSVIISFVIEKDGSVTEAKVVRGVSDDADAEALRVIKKMPKWNPGIQNNQPVRVQYSMPITF